MSSAPRGRKGVQSLAKCCRCDSYLSFSWYSSSPDVKSPRCCGAKCRRRAAAVWQVAVLLVLVVVVVGSLWCSNWKTIKSFHQVAKIVASIRGNARSFLKNGRKNLIFILCLWSEGAKLDNRCACSDHFVKFAFCSSVYLILVDS